LLGAHLTFGNLLVAANLIGESLTLVSAPDRFDLKPPPHRINVLAA
jgi:hypothetical protein